MSKKLLERIRELEEENLRLKVLLDNAHISYNDNLNREELFKKNQELNIIPREITLDDANRFFGMFWGRTDVYSKRVVKKSTGEANYYTQCNNFWKEMCPKRIGCKVKCKDCKYQDYKKLGIQQIVDHLKGLSENGSDVIGVYPMFEDNTCRFIVFDFDNHDGNMSGFDFEKDSGDWREEVDSLRRICVLNGISPLVERSRSGNGAHVWIFFSERIPAKLARRFGELLLQKGSESVNLKTFSYYDRMLPMQDELQEGTLGNLIALPLQGLALKKGNSAFVDENWNVYPDQWRELFSKPKLSLVFIENKLREWNASLTSESVLSDIDNDTTSEKPWERKNCLISSDINGALKITLANGIYVKKDNIQPRLQNRLREMAAFANPEFHKNKAIGLSNYRNSRIMYLGKDYDDYIRIPRGLFEKLLENCRKSNIEVVIDDKRNNGREIDVSFAGELRDTQEKAINKLNEFDNGILQAATAFGKTVVCCDLISKKKVNTLILLESTSLIEQWETALNRFLVIQEDIPEYFTKTGQKRKRKSVIGKLQGAHDSTTGIIDIAMVGSIKKNGEFHCRLKEYGMVIVDECHHAASETFREVLNEIDAKYVFGVTATPHRSDRLDRINYMLLGPIRYKFTAKDRAKEQNIQHLVIPRFTRTILPSFGKEALHPNKAYELLRNDDRDNMIIKDVIRSVEAGRTPIVLSKYVEHSQKLYLSLCERYKNVFLLSGSNSKKVHREIIQKMNSVDVNEELILVATGNLVGEGFDFPRLDTLIMATPVSWRSVVEQYAGRLNRDYEGKRRVEIYDYVDYRIPMFERMYHKRLKAYKQIGYEVSGFSSVIESDLNSIYDFETYANVYREDLLSANKEVIISSPVISGKKIEEIIDLLVEKQANGLEVRIVTWKPEAYMFGDSNYWMELHYKMRNNGFEVNLADKYCQSFCIIDRKIVWYGSMNFLGKEDAEDNLMRVSDVGIASELLEMTFNTENIEKINGERI